MCNYCNTEFYVKVKQYAMPVLAPITRADEIRHELINLTGETYAYIPHLYCPICGERIREVKNEQV